MKTLLALSACALLAASAPVFAQNATNGSSSDLQKNASPNGAAPSHEKQPGASDTESGKAPGVTEGRAGANDETAPGQTGTDKMKPGANTNDTGTTTK